MLLIKILSLPMSRASSCPSTVAVRPRNRDTVPLATLCAASLVRPSFVRSAPKGSLSRAAEPARPGNISSNDKTVSANPPGVVVLPKRESLGLPLTLSREDFVGKGYRIRHSMAAVVVRHERKNGNFLRRRHSKSFGVREPTSDLPHSTPKRATEREGETSDSDN